MKTFLLIAIVLMTGMDAFSQMIMSAEGVNPENVCNPGQVYFLMEKRARPLENIDSIETRLNSTVLFAWENPSFHSKAAVQLAVNCKGGAGGGYHVVTKSGNEELDKQLVSFFKTITLWQSGMIRKKPVDSWYMWIVEIKDGVFDITNR